MDREGPFSSRARPIYVHKVARLRRICQTADHPNVIVPHRLLIIYHSLELFIRVKVMT